MDEVFFHTNPRPGKVTLELAIEGMTQVAATKLLMDLVNSGSMPPNLHVTIRPEA